MLLTVIVLLIGIASYIYVRCYFMLYCPMHPTLKWLYVAGTLLLPLWEQTDDA